MRVRGVHGILGTLDTHGTRGTLLAILAAAAPIALPGCGVGGSRTDAGRDTREQMPRTSRGEQPSLAELIAWQVHTPDTRAISGPHLLTLSRGTGTPPATASASMSLDEAIAALGAEAGSLSPPPATAAPDAPDAPDTPDTPDTPDATKPASAAPTEALAAYARGRWKLLGNDAAGAVTELETATRLDPTAAAAWRTLGEAQWNSGRRSSAIVSFQRAVELGLREPRPLWVAGSELVRTGKRREGLRLLVRARDMAQAEPIFIVPIEVDTAQALWSEGYNAAGLAMLVPALSSLERVQPATRQRPELAEMYRRRGELWMRAGEWALLQGDTELALRAFESASRAPLPDADALTLRRTDALLRAGRSAEAARLIADRVGELGGRVSPTDAELIAHIARHTRAGGALSAELIKVQRELSATTPARTRTQLVRAIATTLPLEEARQTLASAIDDGGEFEPLLTSMLETLWPRAQTPTTSPATPPGADGAATDAAPTLTPQAAGGQAAEVARVVAMAVGTDAERPRIAATVLLLSGRTLGPTLDALATSSAPGARACAAHLALSMGAHDRAVQILQAGKDAASQTLIAQAWASVRTGQFARARAAIAQLDAASPSVAPSPAPGASPRPSGTQTQDAARAREAAGLVRERALVLAELGQLDEAIGALEVEAAATPETQTLVALGELRLRAGDAAGAQRAFDRARELDPGDEAAGGALLSLHGQRGALPDPGRLTALVRDLRANNPGATVLRVEQARELAGRSSLAQAAALLDGIAMQEPEPTGVISTLAAIWERAGRTAPELATRGEAWLRARRIERPDAPLLLIAHARVLASLGRAAEAETLLAQGFDRWPITEIGMARENLVADALREPERALALTRARLAAAPPTPANVIELADVLLRSSMPDEAGKALGERLAPDAPLNTAQLARLAKMLTSIRAEAFVEDPAAAMGALSLFDRIAARGAALTPDLSLTRAKLVAFSAPEDTPAIVAAIDSVANGLVSGPGVGVANEPRLVSQARVAAGVAVAQSLAAMKDATPLLRLLGVLAQRDTSAVRGDATDDLLLEWYRLTFVRGDLEDCLELINGIKDPSRLVEILVAQSDGELDAADGVGEQRVVIAYALASAAHTNERIALAEALYRHTLTLAPDHAWTNNNLGYLLLEAERDLPEAQRLIERAYATMSDQDSVVDSLAWVRYKLGHIEDYTDETGAKVEGAMTLLERAISMGGIANSTIQDHFGDALWRSDRPLEAQRAWSDARSFIQMQLDNYERERQLARDPRAGALPQDQPEPPRIVRLREELRSLSRKLDAAFNGDVPPVAPFAKGVADPLLDPTKP